MQGAAATHVGPCSNQWSLILLNVCMSIRSRIKSKCCSLNGRCCALIQVALKSAKQVAYLRDIAAQVSDRS